MASAKRNPKTTLLGFLVTLSSIITVIIAVMYYLEIGLFKKERNNELTAPTSWVTRAAKMMKGLGLTFGGFCAAKFIKDRHDEWDNVKQREEEEKVRRQQEDEEMMSLKVRLQREAEQNLRAKQGEIPRKRNEERERLENEKKRKEEERKQTEDRERQESFKRAKLAGLEEGRRKRALEEEQREEKSRKGMSWKEYYDLRDAMYGGGLPPL